MGLFRKKRYDKAAQAFESTLRANPNNVLPANNLGDAYAKVSRTENAKAAYARFLALKPDHKLANAARERLAKLSDAGAPG